MTYLVPDEFEAIAKILDFVRLQHENGIPVSVVVNLYDSSGDTLGVIDLADNGEYAYILPVTK